MISGTVLEKSQIILEYDKVLDQKVGEKNYKFQVNGPNIIYLKSDLS